MDVNDRGQAHTVEAFSAAIVLLASVLFALQVTAVTPLTASTASQHIENQQSGVGGGVLDEAAESGALKRTVLYFDDFNGRIHNISSNAGAYTNAGPRTEFGSTLNETFLDRGIAFNLYFVYQSGGSVATEQVVDLGVPSENAVTVHRTVTLYDDDHLYDYDETRNASVTVRNATNYYIADRGANSPVFNVVKVKLTLWRM